MGTPTAGHMPTVGKRNRPLTQQERFGQSQRTQYFFSAHGQCKHVADLVGADSKDIIFTSGATESNNMSIKGVARFHREKKRHIITTQTVRLFLALVCRSLSNSSHRNTNVFWIPAENYQRKASI